MRSKLAMPLSSQMTASPSMMQDRERRRASASTIRGEAVRQVVAEGNRAALRLAENFWAIPQKAEVVCDYSHRD